MRKHCSVFQTKEWVFTPFANNLIFNFDLRKLLP